MKAMPIVAKSTGAAGQHIANPPSQCLRHHTQVLAMPLPLSVYHAEGSVLPFVNATSFP